MSAARAVFVGRERETGELLAGLAEAVGGTGKLFIVEGEPGIGKTRLIEKLASHAPDHGVRVLWSRGWGAGGAPSYWLWIQSIRHFLRAHGTMALASMPAAAVADLSQIVPEIAEHLGSARLGAAVPGVDTDQARFRLFDAITTFFRCAAEEAPLLIVFDDIATADRPSLLILHYLARELPSAPIMAVAACRDAEVRALPSLNEIMSGGKAVISGWRGSPNRKLPSLSERAQVPNPIRARFNRFIALRQAIHSLSRRWPRFCRTTL